VAFKKLWDAFDAGSWVTPQKAVAAYLRDPDFSGQARTRVQARCPIDVSRLTTYDPLERHLAFGRAGPLERSAKAASALIYLLNLFGPSDWLKTELASPDLTALMAAGWDHASVIAKAWLESLKAILKSIAINTTRRWCCPGPVVQVIRDCVGYVNNDLAVSGIGGAVAVVDAIDDKSLH
jgi:hypothetical protein